MSCRHDVQRKLIGAGGDALTSALQEKLAPAFKVGLERVGQPARLLCLRHAHLAYVL
jgi:hypothetical protein